MVMNKKLVQHFQGPGVYSDSNFCWVCVSLVQIFQQILDPMASVLDCYTFAFALGSEKKICRETLRDRSSSRLVKKRR